MDEMKQFRRNADRLGLCDVFARRWSNCKSKKQLYDLACDINSLPYMAEMICKGYGLSPDYLVKEFGQFLNGQCIYQSADGYTSSLYCLPDTDINITTTASLIIGHKGTIIIPKNRVCEIYLCQSDVTIQGEGRGVAYLFDSRITNQSAAPVVVKEDKRYGTMDTPYAV